MNRLFKFSIYFLSICILISLGWWGSDVYKNNRTEKLQLPNWIKVKPLEKYSIENLSETSFEPSEIKINNNIFEFKMNGKKVTGLINIPEGNGPFPIVILLRGYVDQSIYQTGVGTKRVGEYLSENGYTTLAPDFLGYGGSDIESSNIFEARFQTYTTVLTLLKSIEENPPQGWDNRWDKKNLFIWAHSNGGQIALAFLEITGANYPTVLWAPVTESFPYSVLYYTNESADGGKFIRKELAKFEADYDVNKYSLTNYLDKINAPNQYHWGTNDDAMASEWRDRFLTKMKALDKEIVNYNHPGADHNMNPLWGDAINKTLEFFTAKLQ